MANRVLPGQPGRDRDKSDYCRCYDPYNGVGLMLIMREDNDEHTLWIQTLAIDRRARPRPGRALRARKRIAALAQEKFEMKLAYFVDDPHPMCSG